MGLEHICDNHAQIFSVKHSGTELVFWNLMGLFFLWLLRMTAAANAARCFPAAAGTGSASAGCLA